MSFRHLPSSLLSSAMLFKCLTAAVATSATLSIMNEPSVSKKRERGREGGREGGREDGYMCE